MKAEHACIVCGGRYQSASINGLLQCETCGFITADVSLSREELERIYSEKYFHGEEYRDYVGEQAIFAKQFQRRLKVLLRHVDEGNRGRLFEIGAAYGFFLDLARRHFKQVSGIDLSRDAAEYATHVLGVPVSSGDFLECTLLETIDVVCMWDTIEHLADPDLYLEKAAMHMPIGGKIAITTGDIGSIVARWRKGKWRQVHPPTHLQYFSKATLKQLLVKHGFEVLYCGYDGCYRSVDTAAYIVLALKRNKPELYEKLKATGILNWSFYSNFYDTMYVIAEKSR
jgi:2-polyprenyl-3-methyl-5-hydroxy-6-metoxy-1,4-benzoquinol methylase